MNWPLKGRERRGGFDGFSGPTVNDLVAAVQDILRDLGFEVRNMDAALSKASRNVRTCGSHIKESPGGKQSSK